MEYIFESGYHSLENIYDEQKRTLIDKIYLKMCYTHNFSHVNQAKFNKQALINILIEERLFTGFEFESKVHSPTMSKIKAKFRSKLG